MSQMRVYTIVWKKERSEVKTLEDGWWRLGATHLQAAMALGLHDAIVTAAVAGVGTPVTSESTKELTANHLCLVRRRPWISLTCLP